MTGEKMTATGFLNKIATVDGTDYPYVVYVPHDYAPAKKWPSILFLHGRERAAATG